MSAPVETKVTAASLAAAVAAFAVSYLVLAIPSLASIADPIQAVLISLLTSAAAWLAGWWAKHSPRPPVAPFRDRSSL